MATNRVHYYHADVCGFGGFLERPFEQNIDPQASLSLSPAGGYGSARSENFRLDGLFSYDTAYTQVSGRLSQKENGGWLTLSTATVEGLNILDVITADRISAQVSTEHPLEGDNPKVSFLGSTFENLKIGGHRVDVALDLEICDQGNGRAYPKDPCVCSDNFLSKVKDQYKQMTAPQPAAKKEDNPLEAPEWVKQRYDSNRVQDPKCGYVLASLVKPGAGNIPGRRFVNAFEIPDIGRLFLGELMVDSHTFRLTMLRLELGCRVEGSLSGPTCLANGVTKPPS